MFSTNLRTLRKTNGYSQEELATRLNVVRQTVSKWEKGLSVPDADLLIRLAEIFEVSVSELLGEKIESEHEQSSVAEQLSRVNEQLAISNRRSRRVWTGVAIAAGVATLTIGVMLVVKIHSSLTGDSYRGVISSYETGFGVSSAEARRIYDTEVSDHIRGMLLQNPNIEEVKVTVSSAEQSPFLKQDDASKTSVSIEIKLTDEGVISDTEAQMIADLVKASIPGIEYGDIAITDQSSNAYPVGGNG